MGETTKTAITTIIMKVGVEVAAEEEDVAGEGFEDVEVTEVNMSPEDEPSLILLKEEIYFPRMRREAVVEAEFVSIIFTRDSCSNITDQEVVEMKKKKKGSTKKKKEKKDSSSGSESDGKEDMPDWRVDLLKRMKEIKSLPPDQLEVEFKKAMAEKKRREEEEKCIQEIKQRQRMVE